MFSENHVIRTIEGNAWELWKLEARGARRVPQKGYALRILFDELRRPFLLVPFLWANKEKEPGAQGRSAREFDFDDEKEKLLFAGSPTEPFGDDGQCLYPVLFIPNATPFTVNKSTCSASSRSDGVSLP